MNMTTIFVGFIIEKKAHLSKVPTCTLMTAICLYPLSDVTEPKDRTSSGSNVEFGTVSGPFQLPVTGSTW